MCDCPIIDSFNAMSDEDTCVNQGFSPPGKLFGKKYVAQLALSIGFPGPILPVPEVKILKVQPIHLMC